jgi:long-subunit acyl-CoA synthetase (AMP-forming)
LGEDEQVMLLLICMHHVICCLSSVLAESTPAQLSSRNLCQFAFTHSAYLATCLLVPQASPLADMLAFNNIKTKLGGRVRLILSGAAPLAKPAQEFLSCCMCAPVLQGYGLTETCAASSIAEPFRWDTIGTVGAPMPGKDRPGDVGLRQRCSMPPPDCMSAHI